MKRPKLTTEPARMDLTDRECSKLLGGTIGALLQMATMNDVRNAVRWWAGLDNTHWNAIAKGTRLIHEQAARAAIRAQGDEK